VGARSDVPESESYMATNRSNTDPEAEPDVDVDLTAEDISIVDGEVRLTETGTQKLRNARRGD